MRKLFGIQDEIGVTVVVVVSGEEGRGEEPLSVDSGDKHDGNG
jgi:hypothetical protein